MSGNFGLIVSRSAKAAADFSTRKADILFETLENLKDGRGSVGSLPQVTTTSVPSDVREIALIDQLRRSVKRAGSITIQHKEYSITFHDVDFRDAERPPQPLRLSSDFPRR